MSLLSPIFGGSQSTAPTYTRNETQNSEPAASSTSDAGTSQPQESEPTRTQDTAAPSTTTTQSAAAAQSTSGEPKATDVSRNKSLALQAQADLKDNSNIENDRRAAQQRIDEARVNMLFEQVSPVATSPAQGIKSYMETLMKNPAAEKAPVEKEAIAAAA